MESQLLRVAAYARVSTDKEDQANSLVSQRKYFQEYIMHQEGWELSDIYYDEGVSGTQTRKRAGFHQMVEDALAGKIDLILTKEVCRFARNTVDTLSYTRKLREAGIGVIFTIDNIDTRDSDGELRLTIMASIAQEESRKTSERVKWGQKRRMEQGIVFGRDLLGYTVKNGMLFINEEEVPGVKAIFHKYTNEGKGVHVIARELLAEGILPKRNNRWSETVILRILRNEKYVGDLCQKKTYTPNYLTHKKKYNDGAEEKVYISHHHQPIIDRELWERTQKELRGRTSPKNTNARYSSCYWCSGKICCGECGSSFVSRTKKLAAGTYRAWRCYQAANHGSAKLDAGGNRVGCDNHSINDRALLACMEYCVGDICRKGCGEEMLRQKILSRVRQICDKGEMVDLQKEIHRKIEGVENKKRKAVDAMLEGILTKEELEKQREWYDRELERLSRVLAENRETGHIDAINRDNEILENALDEILLFGRENNILFGEILEKITIYPDSQKGCHQLMIRLKYLPFSIRLKIQSAGKGKAYHTDILEMKYIPDRFR